MQHLRFTLQGNSPFLCQESAAERLSIRPRLCVALDSNEYGRPATILYQKKKISKQCATARTDPRDGNNVTNYTWVCWDELSQTVQQDVADSVGTLPYPYCHRAWHRLQT